MLGYSPTVKGISVNVIRSVSETYIRGVIPSLIEREGIHCFHLLLSPPFITVQPLTALSEKVLVSLCCWGVQRAFPNIGAHRGARRITYDGWKEIKHHKTSGGVL